MFNNGRNKALEEKCLEVLSFFDYLPLEKIFLEIDPEFIEHNNHLTYEDLLTTLEKLQKSKKVIRKIDEGCPCFKRLFPKKSLLKRLKSFFKV